MGSSSVWVVVVPSLGFILCSVLIFFMGFSVVKDCVSLFFELDLLPNYCLPGGVVFVIDSASLLIGGMVLFISGCVLCYCGFYMAEDIFLVRFCIVLVSFVLAMCCLVFCPSFVGLLVGWDGLGMSSFLLVIYYINKECLSAGMLTALSNRVGDVLFILSIGVVSSLISNPLVSGVFFGGLSAFSGFIIFGSMTNSAQMPFSAWLPAAMAAPTPVSALVHSSTLVTGGVYVLFRYSDVFSELLLVLLSVISLITVIIAGIGAAFEMDIKKVVALSTLSQVGVMVFALALDLRIAALYHLLNHAFVKALLFLCVGSAIYFSGGNQDGRLFGGLGWGLPITSSWLVISLISLSGVPFLSCFYSKELVIIASVEGGLSVVSLFLLYVSIALTAYYCVRICWVLLFKENKECVYYYNEDFYFVAVPIVLLGVMSVVSGGLFQLVVGGFCRWTYVISVENQVILVLISISAVVFTLKVSGLYFYTRFNLVVLHAFVQKIWYLPFMSGNQLSSVFLMFCVRLYVILEKGWLEGFVWGKGLTSFFGGISEGIWKVHNHSLGTVFCGALTSVIIMVVLAW